MSFLFHDRDRRTDRRLQPEALDMMECRKLAGVSIWMFLMFSEWSLLLLDPKVRGELGKGEKLEVLDTTSELPNALGIQLVCANHHSFENLRFC